GCGLDGNYDLAVREGGTGLDHFAIRATRDDLERYEHRLREAGVDVSRTDGTEPGQVAGIRFELPMGAAMELVTVEDTRYHHVSDPRLPARRPWTPLDADHITFAAKRLRENVRFLEEVLDFNVAEVLEGDDDWGGAFLHRGSRYHDIGFVTRHIRDTAVSEPFHTRHVAWTVASLDHLKQFVDRLVATDRELEVSVHRHYAGDALAAYFWEPGGNRFEVCTEEAPVDASAPTSYIDSAQGYTAWGGVNPSGSYDTGT
ncbi:MAG: VOC family protein, partial [Halobacteriales archaeon]|nr:VOC family protein [Halobacteriales archaeon]